MTKGQRAYEADVLERPTYTDGTPRRSWDELSATARMAWEHNPFPLPCAPINVGRN